MTRELKIRIMDSSSRGRSLLPGAPFFVCLINVPHSAALERKAAAYRSLPAHPYQIPYQSSLIFSVLPTMRREQPKTYYFFV